MLALDGVSFSYRDGVPVIPALDLTVGAGEITALLGPSGCGKSTILRLVAGLLTPTGGTVRHDQPDARRGFVFQDAALMPWANVFDNTALPLSLAGRPDVAAVDAALAAVGLTGLSGRYPDALSGGQRMRVSIARAMVARPSLLLMDEPFAALDEILRFQMNQLLLDLTAREGWGVLFVTHSLYEAAFLADRILVMQAGRVAGEVIPALDRTLNPADQRASPAFAGAVRQATRLLEGAS